MTDVLPFPGQHHGQPGLIPEPEVTLDRLRLVIETAALDVRLDEDGDLYIFEGLEFPIWVSLDTPNKFVRLVTAMKLKERTADVLAAVNDMNANIVMPQFCHRADGVWGTYWLPYAEGLSARQFIKAARFFAESFRVGLERHRELFE